MPEISRDRYEALLEAYRQRPGSHSAVAKTLDPPCWHGTARRYWERGGSAAWAEPIKDVIERERVKLRADLEERRESAELAHAEELGKLDAVRARVDATRHRIGEAAISRQVRENAAALLELISVVLEGAAGLQEELRDSFASGSIRKLVEENPVAAVDMIAKLASLAKDGTQAAEAAVKLERLITGEPTERVATNIENAEEAAAVIARAAAAARRRGLAVIDGEASPAGPPALPAAQNE